MTIPIDRFLTETEHDARSHLTIPGALSAIQIDGVGTPLAGGPWRTLRFPNGGVTDLGGGVANVAVVGPQGPQGIQGVQGPAGPAGPGFTTFAVQFSAELKGPGLPGGQATHTLSFTFGFNPRHASPFIAMMDRGQSSTDADDKYEITAVAIVGNQVNITVSMPAGAGSNEMAIKVGCAAAG